MGREIPRDGRMYELPTDERDQGKSPNRDRGTVVGRHGGKFVGGCTLHIPGVTDRDEARRSVHNMIVQMPREGIADGELCGVEHVEDIGIWETPHSGRAELRREIARLGKRHQRPVVIVHGYQHVGPCPTES